MIRGSQVMMADVLNRAPGNWYIEANEARSRTRVRRVVRTARTDRFVRTSVRTAERVEPARWLLRGRTLRTCSHASAVT